MTIKNKKKLSLCADIPPNRVAWNVRGRTPPATAQGGRWAQGQSPRKKTEGLHMPSCSHSTTPEWRAPTPPLASPLPWT